MGKKIDIIIHAASQASPKYYGVEHQWANWKNKMKKIEKVKLIKLQIFGDARGSLVSLEQYKNIPFNIKRVYYIFDTKRDTPRGFHAHKTLEQVLICVNGACKIKVDDGKNVDIFNLFSPEQGLYIGNNIWREMFDFSQGCVLLVLASRYYDPKEYIKDYSEFLKSVRCNRKG
ncbi:MAG: FdtA/QdtA family cupin domain-containing protein [Endomicrobium sp.]|jgi:dTDP-4-dehydrorhamnose 3,5-epimerase-like enzyme|nr:FdtA/QdtA family cupin domain-containing protein [Endomicrobium sp.]